MAKALRDVTNPSPITLDAGTPILEAARAIVLAAISGAPPNR